MGEIGFWKSVGLLVRKVPVDLAGAVVIIFLIVYLIHDMLPQLKSDTDIDLVLGLLAILVIGCTYCIVMYAHSRAQERRDKSIQRSIDTYRKYFEQFGKTVSSEIEKATNSMRGEEDEQ
jgi:hypothetical protein